MIGVILSLKSALASLHLGISKVPVNEVLVDRFTGTPSYEPLNPTRAPCSYWLSVGNEGIDANNHFVISQNLEVSISSSIRVCIPTSPLYCPSFHYRFMFHVIFHSMLRCRFSAVLVSIPSLPATSKQPYTSPIQINPVHSFFRLLHLIFRNSLLNPPKPKPNIIPQYPSYSIYSLCIMGGRAAADQLSQHLRRGLDVQHAFEP